MASIQSQAILLLTVSCMLTVSSANRGWFWGFNCTWPFKHGHPSPSPPPLPPPSPPPSQSPRKIIVGGSEHWHFGFDYNNWALKNSPFYLNDTLVFKYDPPNSTTFPHSVYLLPDMWSFFNCDLKRAKKVANWTQGSGDGFEFVLKRWKPYYFACGERDGFHCSNGTMKFFVMPIVRGSWF